MYHKVYYNHNDTRVAGMFLEEKMFDIAGNEVQNEKEMFGKLTKYYLKHPNYFLMVDEVSSNLYYSTDKNTDREKYIKSYNSGHTYIYSNNNECRFSILSFTTANKESIICICII